MPERFKLAEVSELDPGDRKHVDVKGKEITLMNIDGEYYAVENFCPHMGGPVGNGPLSTANDRPVIMCPFHEWRFDLETGDVIFPGKKRIMSYDVSLEQYDVDIQEDEENISSESGVFISL